MTNNVTRSGVHEAMLNMLAADYNCAPELLLAEGVSVTEAAELPGRRSYPIPENPLIAVTLGAGVVISTSPSRLPQIDTLVRDRSRDEIFSIPILAQLDTLVRSDGQSIAGPYLRTVCSRDRFIAPAELSGVSISVLKDGDVASLYEYPGFHNALAYRVGDVRRDSLCVVARRDGMLVGVAGANVDSPAFWQIGIDVVPDERGRGVGRAIVGRLTEAILDAGAIPYYSTTTTNIASRNLAQSLGFWPAWTEIYVTDMATHE